MILFIFKSIGDAKERHFDNKESHFDTIDKHFDDREGHFDAESYEEKYFYEPPGKIVRLFFCPI